MASSVRPRKSPKRGAARIALAQSDGRAAHRRPLDPSWRATIAVLRIAESAGDCFFAADRDRPFSGSRPGYVFKLGARGLGYYPDYRAPENWAAWERSFSVRDRTRRAWKQRVRDARAQLAHVRGQLEDDYVRILCDARTAADRRAFEEQRGAWLESRDDLAEDVPDHLFEE